MISAKMLNLDELKNEESVAIAGDDAADTVLLN